MEKIESTCIYCGIKFHPKQQCHKTFCSRECYFDSGLHGELRKGVSRITSIKEYICIKCGNKFSATYTRKNLCTKCKVKEYDKKGKGKLINKTCEVCLNAFQGKDWVKTCSLECRTKARLKRKQEILSCFFCKKEFIANEYRKKYCSEICRKKRKLESQKQQKRNKRLTLLTNPRNPDKLPLN